MPSYKKLCSRLEDAKDQNRLTEHVAQYVLDYYTTSDEIQHFFSDLLSHGCQSGMIGHLIYYRDTAQFFDTYYDEIEALREDYESEVGESLDIRGDLKNFMAWFGFEEATRKLAGEIGIEI